MSLESVVRGVRKTVLLLMVLATVVGCFCPAPAHAQDTTERKIKAKIAPTYPDIARKMGLSGTVRLEIVILPNGSVKDTKVIGGHPILVNAAVDAVKKWRFETASAESTETVQVKFDNSEY